MILRFYFLNECFMQTSSNSVFSSSQANCVSFFKELVQFHWFKCSSGKVVVTKRLHFQETPPIVMKNLPLVKYRLFKHRSYIKNTLSESPLHCFNPSSGFSPHCGVEIRAPRPLPRNHPGPRPLHPGPTSATSSWPN